MTGLDLRGLPHRFQRQASFRRNVWEKVKFSKSHSLEQVATSLDAWLCPFVEQVRMLTCTEETVVS